MSRSDHFLLNARAGWRNAALDHLVLADGGASLQLQPLPGSGRPLVDAGGDFGGLAEPTGLAIDSEDRVTILDGKAHQVKRFDPCAPGFQVLPCIGTRGDGARQLRDPHGIAISRRDDLYIADTGNRRVSVFALKGLPLRAVWGPFQVKRGLQGMVVRPVQAERPAPALPGACTTEPRFPDGTWQPWDIALTPGCRAYVSDYANGLIHLFDGSGRWRAAYDGASAENAPLDKPTALALDAEGQLYIVQEGKDYVVVLDAQGAFVRILRRPEEVQGDFRPICVCVDREGTLHLGDGVTGGLYVYPAPMAAMPGSASDCPHFRGRATSLAFDLAGNPLVGDSSTGQVLSLPAKAIYETQGLFVSEPLDSEIYRCMWHRVALRATLTPGTLIRVETLTDDTPRDIAEIQQMPPERWNTGQIDAQVGTGEWDCLILSQPGRYLWLRLTLMGEGITTPILCQVRVYFPRRSSLQYLPATYQEDAVSRDFLDRFLSLFDTVWNGIGNRLDNIAGYFDPASAPAQPTKAGGNDFLTWLASWLDLSLDRHWPLARRRELVRQAHRLYALRGTPEGLRLHLRLYTGIEPRILEHYKLRRWLFLGDARLGDRTALWGKAVVQRLQLDGTAQIGSFQLIDTGDPLRDPFYVYAHQCTVFIPLAAPADATQQQTLRRIIEMAKPAHTQADIQFVAPGMRIGVQSFVGVDTVIGKYPEQVMLEAARLGYDAVLGPSEDEAHPPTMRIGVRARIGTSSYLD